MKKLYLIRHAKSSWKDLSLSDHDRPLKKRGINDSNLIAKELLKRGVKVDLIISSSAKRALESAKILNEYLNSKIKIEPSLYSCKITDYLEILKKYSSLDSIAIVAHNPEINEFAQYLDSNFKEYFKTAAVAAFRVKDFANLTPNSAKLEFFIYPKMFK